MDHTAEQIRRFYRSLTRNMVITIILVAALPLIVISGITRHYFQVSYREKVQSHLKAEMLRHKHSIDDFFGERLAGLQLLARTHSFEQLTDETYLAGLLVSLQELFGKSVGDLAILDEHGTVRGYAGPFKSQQADDAVPQWFGTAIQQEHFVSDLLYGPGGVPYFVITAGQNRQGKRWVLKSTVDFVTVDTLVRSMRIGETGIGFILNAKGEFQSKLSTRQSIPIKLFVDFLASRPHTPNEIVISECNGESGGDCLNLMALIREGQWVLGFRQNEDEAYRALYSARRFAVITFLAGVLCIVAVALVLSRRTVRRIQQTDEEKRSINEQLIETGKLASLGELAGGIAHEINNPVAIMVEEAGWLRDIIEDEDITQPEHLAEIKHGLSKIQTQGRRCKDITHKLLSFARKTDHSVKLIQLNDIVTEVVELSVKRAYYSGITVQTTLQEDLPMVSASPSEMQQVLLNMINNSMDALVEKGGGGTILVVSRMDGDRVLVEVSDDGPGIPESVLPRIFEPFFTTKPVGKGTGLGLSICYGIIKKLGGEINVSSADGKGVKFQMYFRQAPGEA